MKHRTGIVVLAASTLYCGLASPAAAAGAADNLNNYLVGITGGAVSAGSLIGLDKGPTQIETSQDLIVALQPLASGDSKSAFGLAITPARTTLTPMAGSTYVGNAFWRLLGSATLSYAQNRTKVANVEYERSAFSLGTVYYFDKSQDPVVIGNAAFTACLTPERLTKNAGDLAAIEFSTGLSQEGKQAAREALTAKLAAALEPCIDEALRTKTRWNAGRLSLSLGEGRIKSAAGDSRSLGRSITLNAQLPAGDAGVALLSLRRTSDGLDLASLGTATPVARNSTLAAMRFTYGEQTGSSLRAVAEASNSKSRTAAAFKDTFIFALGIDKQIASGTWLEIRVGRNRALENGREQTAALMNLNISPTLFALKK